MWTFTKYSLQLAWRGRHARSSFWTDSRMLRKKPLDYNGMGYTQYYPTIKRWLIFVLILIGHMVRDCSDGETLLMTRIRQADSLLCDASIVKSEPVRFPHTSAPSPLSQHAVSGTQKERETASSFSPNFCLPYHTYFLLSSPMFMHRAMDGNRKWRGTQ